MTSGPTFSSQDPYPKGSTDFKIVSQAGTKYIKYVPISTPHIKHIKYHEEVPVPGATMTAHPFLMATLTGDKS